MIPLIRGLRSLSAFYPFPTSGLSKNRYQPFLPFDRFSIAPISYQSLARQTKPLKNRALQVDLPKEGSQARFSFLPWGIAGLCLGIFLFKKKESLVSFSHCQGHGVLARLKDNGNLSDEALKKKFSLQEDPTVVGKVHPSQESSTWYKVNGLHPENPFRVKIEEGQLVWQAIDLVNPTYLNGKLKRNDMADLAQMYRKVDPERTLVINTGIHGNKRGEILYKIDCNTFVRQDMDMALTLDSASTHPVSPDRPPYTHEDPHAKNKDIVDAWCYSARTDRSKGFAGHKQLNEEKGSSDCRCGRLSPLSYEDILASFHLLGYKASTDNDEALFYVHIEKCQQEVLARLARFSRCYIHGDGGMGKSRLSLEIQQAIQSQYTDVVRIALRGSSKDWLKFIEYAEKIVHKDRARSDRERDINNLIPFDENETLKAYFSKLGEVADRVDKKILVIVDNVDDLNEYKKFSQICAAIESVKQQGNPFVLLVTGRRPLSDEFEKSQIVEIAEHWNQEFRWTLFLENFLKGLDEKISKEEARNYVEKKSDVLRERFKEFEDITAFIVTISKLVAQGYNQGKAKKADGIISTMTSRICSILNGMAADRQKDYKLGYLLPALLEMLSVENAKLNLAEMKYIFEILALISDGEVPENVLENVFLHHKGLLNCSEEDMFRSAAEINFYDITDAMASGGFIRKEFDHSQLMIQMTSNYNFLIRLMLSAEYKWGRKEKKQQIAEQIKAIEGILCDRLKTSDLSRQDDIREYLKLLLGLMSYSSDKLGSGLSEAVKEETKKLIADRLVSISYDDFIGKYKFFFSKISSLEGYSISPQLVKLFKSLPSDYKETIQGQIKDLIDRLKQADKKNESQVARELNNCVVIAKNLAILFDEKNVETALNKVLKSIDVDSVTKEGIQANLSCREPEKLFVFPEIKAQEIASGIRQRALKWLEDNEKVLQSQKKANLSQANLKEALSPLIQRLTAEVELETVDLSYNKLSDDPSAVTYLLKYARSLKVLDLSNNYLYKDGYVYSSDNAHIILRALKEGKSLEKIILNDNSMTDKEILVLCEALKDPKDHPNLKEIHLHNNYIGLNGLNALLALMQGNPSIQLIKTELASKYSPGAFRLSHDGTKTIKRVNGVCCKLK